tara:strand:- start:483 stop:599 length:117 start_codon:yes stop_codon:yes gene_type:complete
MPRDLREFGLIEAIEELTQKTFNPLEIDCEFEHFKIQK